MTSTAWDKFFISLVSFITINKYYLFFNIKLIVSGVAGAMQRLAAKLVEEGNNLEQELLSRTRRMAELTVLAKIFKKLTVILKSALEVMILYWFTSISYKRVYFLCSAFVSFIITHHWYVWINNKWTVNGVAGALWPHAVKPVAEELNCIQEQLSSMKKMTELFVLEKIYKKLNAILMIVPQVTLFPS